MFNTITPDPLHLVIFIGNTFDLTPIHKIRLIASTLKSGTVSLRVGPGENFQLNHALRKNIDNSLLLELQRQDSYVDIDTLY